MDVKQLLGTARLGGASWSLDGQRIAYISNASGRLNLWVMKADGSGARQLLSSNDRQAEPVWSVDGTQIVYTQDTGGDEMYDLYALAADGGAPKDLTQTPQVSETSPLFSRDGAWLAFTSKAKTSPWRDVAVMEWKTGAIRQLTHEADPKATWSIAAWSPDGRYIYATRTVEREDSDIYRIEVKSGVAEKLTSHEGNVLHYRKRHLAGWEDAACYVKREGRVLQCGADGCCRKDRCAGLLTRSGRRKAANSHPTETGLCIRLTRMGARRLNL